MMILIVRQQYFSSCPHAVEYSLIPFVFGGQTAGGTTFFSLLVWNFDTYVNHWNPRDMEGYVLAAIINAIEAAESKYPEGSTEQVNIQRKYDYYLGVENHMERINCDKWCGPLDHDRYLAVDSRVDTSRSFPTARASNLTVPVLNVTTACSMAFQLATSDGRTCMEILSNGGASV